MVFNFSFSYYSMVICLSVYSLMSSGGVGMSVVLWSYGFEDSFYLGVGLVLIVVFFFIIVVFVFKGCGF